MKKNIFLAVLLIAVSAASHAQFTVWEDDFNDGDVSDWTLLDLDGNGSNWAATGNLQISNEGTPFFGTEYAVLSTYNISLEDGSPLPTGEDNWAVSPAIDLSFYTGTTQLIINAQTAIYDGSQDLYVYASTSAEQSSFEIVGTITLVREPNGSTDVQFNEYTVDISEFVGESQVYIALKPITTSFVGYEIDNISITVEGILGADDVAGKTATIIKQNPVAGELKLQLGNTVNAHALSLKLYDMSGMLVKEAKYSEAGVSVSDLAGGMYFAVLTDGVVTERLKFIKK